MHSPRQTSSNGLISSKHGWRWRILLFFRVLYIIQGLLYGVVGILINKLTKEHSAMMNRWPPDISGDAPTMIIGTGIDAGAIIIQYWM